MKNLKRNNRILSYIICFSLLAFVNISCNENDDLEIIEESETNKKEALAEAMAKGGNIKRTRMKERSNGLYRASIVVNKDNKDEVSTIALEIEKKEGVLNETKTYYLDYYTTVKKDKYYTFADIKFDGKELDNQEVTVNITLLGANKKPISIATETITIEGLSKATISKRNINPSIFFYPKSTRLGLTADIDNNEDNDVAEAAITIDDLQGNRTFFNVAPKKNNTIKTDFSFEKETISKQMNVTIILKDFYGDEISTFKEEVSVTSGIIGDPVLTQNDDKKTFSLTIPLNRKQLGKDYKDLRIYVELKATNSKNYYEGTNFRFKEITKGLVIYENNSITFLKPNNVIGKQYAVQITVADANGEELDYAEFRIVGLE
jgi:hypothetical protein